MHGFATLDICDSAGQLTVWHTSPMDTTGAGHTARYLVRLDRGLDRRRLEGLFRHRYVVTTRRTQLTHPAVAQWSFDPVDVDQFADEVRAAQHVLVQALRGRGRPVVRPVPSAVHEARFEGADPAELTLAVADRVQRVWTAWLSREAERVKRRAELPDHLADPPVEVLPPSFAATSALFGGATADPKRLAG